jgi:hypothetical protein
MKPADLTSDEAGREHEDWQEREHGRFRARGRRVLSGRQLDRKIGGRGEVRRLDEAERHSGHQVKAA